VLDISVVYDPDGFIPSVKEFLEDGHEDAYVIDFSTRSRKKTIESLN
jgi:hypothetical protein